MEGEEDQDPSTSNLGVGPCALGKGAYFPGFVRVQPYFERIYKRDEITVVANSAADGILKHQHSPDVEAMDAREAEIRSSAFAAVS
jgi:hypothetical protein